MAEQLDSKMEDVKDKNNEDFSQDTISVRFVTKISDKKFHVNDTGYDLPTTFTTKLLNGTINELLKNEKNMDINSKKINFSFLIKNNYLNKSIKKHLNTYGISSENTINIEYIYKTVEPSSKCDNNHPDWISSIDLIPNNNSALYVTGCYDGIVRIWDNDNNNNENNKKYINNTDEKPEKDDNNSAKKLHKDPSLYAQYRGHFAPIKGVSYLHSNEKDNNICYFVSASKNCELKVFELNKDKRKITPLISLDKSKVNKSHRMNIETICAPNNSKIFCTGSNDNNIRVYRFNDGSKSSTVANNKDQESSHKPPKKKQKIVDSNHNYNYSLDCLCVLRAHKNKIKYMDWCLNLSEALYSCSWDKTIKLWNVTKEIDTYTWKTNSSINVIKYWYQQNLLLSAHTNNKICLWDPRTDKKVDTKHIKSKYVFRSHALPITDLAICSSKYSPNNGNNTAKIYNNNYLFCSSSHDGKIKIWDLRNKIPLYNIKKHYGKVLCCKWYKNIILSGGSDSQLRSFVFK